MGQLRSAFGWVALAAIGVAALGPGASAGVAWETPETELSEWSASLWNAARHGDLDNFGALLDEFPGKDAEASELASTVDRLIENHARVAEDRSERLADAREELAEAVAGEDVDLSEALALAVELQMLTGESEAIAADPLVRETITRAERAARKAEASGEWLTSYELFYRLDSLYDIDRRYKDDLDRQAARLSMIQLYAPERWWGLRNEQVVADGEDPLPPYNAAGNDFRDKLAGIDVPMVRRAILRGYDGNVDHVGLGRMIIGGLDAIRTLVTTSDLQEAFPGLKEPGAREALLAYLNEQTITIQRRMGNPGEGDAGAEDRALRGLRGDGVDTWDLTRSMDGLLRVNSRSARLPETALLHEFGNGAMSELDQFSGVIWPDQWSRFQRSTRGSFVGVGIQIELDARRRIRVVTPLDGTPAQRAGIIPGDVIVAVDGESTLGFTLDQAVEVITGPRNTEVALTVERKLGATDDDVEKLTYELTRREIELVTVKGWRRSGKGEHDWDWFIDPEAGIGYVRLTNFDEKTARDFDRAIAEMKDRGLEGLVLDLRYNPGGLLEQAVEISNRFIGIKNAPIVTTHQDGRVVDTQVARSRNARLAGVPTVVLINEGSASASEIVAGAIQHYSRAGEVPALVVGQRSYGKGSVQNVYPLTSMPTRAAVKVTTQQYRLPGGEWIHRRPGAREWGVDPDLEVDLLPTNIARSLAIRRRADLYDPEVAAGGPEPAQDEQEVVEVAADGEDAEADEPVPAYPEAIFEEGVDLQLEAAVLLLEARAQARPQHQAMLDVPLTRQGG